MSNKTNRLPAPDEAQKDNADETEIFVGSGNVFADLGLLMRKRNRWIVLGAMLLIGVVAFFAYCPSPLAPNLIKRATKIADVQDLLSYSWLSSHELLVKTDTNGFPIKRTPWSGHIDLIDIRAGTRTVLKGLAAVITRHIGHYDFLGPWGFERSPDSQWLLWGRDDPLDGGLYPVTARMDGSGYHEWKASANAWNLWIDGCRWVSSIRRKQAEYLIVHDATQRHADRQLPSASLEAQALLKLAQSRYWFTTDARGRLLQATPAQNKPSNLVFHIETKPAGSPPGTPFTQIDTISFPYGTRIYDNIPNSQMTRIEFMVSETHIPYYANLMHRLLPAYSHPFHPVERLCIYRLDKKKLYEVGRVEGTSASNPDLINAFWLPDGKHIEFLYKNAVYTVPID